MFRYNSEQVTPYHNWYHAMSTCQLTYLLMAQSCSLQSDLDKIDLFVALFAPLGHDAGHRGRNNPFECMTGSDVAVRYNDQSVLEMHHAAVSFDALMKVGFIKYLSKE